MGYKFNTRNIVIETNNNKVKIKFAYGDVFGNTIHVLRQLYNAVSLLLRLP